MKRCFALADEAEQKNENPVGAILTDGSGNIIAEAIEGNKSKNDITCHAEIEVIRMALQKLKTSRLPETILYTTHEPCIMCSYVIRHYEIAKVIYANESGETGGINSLFQILRTDIISKWKAPPEIMRYTIKN